MSRDLLLELKEAIEQLDEWSGANVPRRKEMSLYWAERVHHLSTLVLSKMQDKTEKEREGPPYK